MTILAGIESLIISLYKSHLSWYKNPKYSKERAAEDIDKALGEFSIRKKIRNSIQNLLDEYKDKPEKSYVALLRLKEELKESE